MTAGGDRIRPDVRALEPYHVPAVGDVVKLDAMESPYPWPDDDLRAAWARVLADVPVNRYPDPRATGLARRLRAHLGLADDRGLILGNGSDELIERITLAVARPGATVLAPEPTFVMYRVIAAGCGVGFTGVPLCPDFELDVEAMMAAIDAHDPAVVWLARPNNPTGNAWPRAAVEAIADRAGGLVVVDEAYQPFAGDSLVDTLGQRPDVAVLRTLSKLGLAGLRLGALAGPRPWLDEIDKLRLPYNVNALTQAGAAFALDHFDRLQARVAAIRAERDRLRASLEALPGVDARPSAANFVLLRLPAGRARPVFDGLLEEGVLVKCLDGAHPLLADCLRVTVGTPAENERLEAALARQLDAAA